MIQQSTLDFIRRLEGARRKAYKDVASLDTIGVGHLVKANEKHLLSKTLSEKEINDLLINDLKWAEEAISALVRVPMSANQFDALASFVFNVGVPAFKKSTLLKKINAGKSGDEISSEFMKWVKAGGKTSKGLINRRAAEAKLFNAPHVQPSIFTPNPKIAP